MTLNKDTDLSSMGSVVSSSFPVMSCHSTLPKQYISAALVTASASVAAPGAGKSSGTEATADTVAWQELSRCEGCSHKEGDV